MSSERQINADEVKNRVPFQRQVRPLIRFKAIKLSSIPAELLMSFDQGKKIEPRKVNPASFAITKTETMPILSRESAPRTTTSENPSKVWHLQDSALVKRAIQRTAFFEEFQEECNLQSSSSIAAIRKREQFARLNTRLHAGRVSTDEKQWILSEMDRLGPKAAKLKTPNLDAFKNIGAGDRLDFLTKVAIDSADIYKTELAQQEEKRRKKVEWLALPDVERKRIIARRCREKKKLTELPPEQKARKLARQRMANRQWRSQLTPEEHAALKEKARLRRIQLTTERLERKRAAERDNQARRALEQDEAKRQHLRALQAAWRARKRANKPTPEQEAVIRQKRQAQWAARTATMDEETLKERRRRFARWARERLERLRNNLEPAELQKLRQIQKQQAAERRLLLTDLEMLAEERRSKRDIPYSCSGDRTHGSAIKARARRLIDAMVAESVMDNGQSNFRDTFLQLRQSVQVKENVEDEAELLLKQMEEKQFEKELNRMSRLDQEKKRRSQRASSSKTKPSRRSNRRRRRRVVSEAGTEDEDLEG